ncbi:MAG TPA: hypothetical protein VL992_09525 [Tepidisphaeraceae bacterium]|nr:hypothetical protein [Tepidisphaeraceae bacterium]
MRLASSPSSVLSPRLCECSAVLFFFASLALVFGAFSVGRKVNVDENVFITSAALVSKGYTLYRDFHYNHMPTLVLLYALLFRMTSYFLLAARSVEAICAAGTATVLFVVARRELSWLDQRRQLRYALLIGLFYLCNPLFTRTAGRAWNHDFPVFFSLLGYLAAARGLPAKKFSWLLLSGLCVGLAVTARLTFATEMLPFAVFILIHPGIKTGRRIGLLFAFSLGWLIAFAPSAWVWAQSPANAYFGNFQYPKFNTEWHMLHDDEPHHRYSLLPKMWFYVFNTCLELPGNGMVLIAFLLLSWRMLNWRQIWRDAWHCQLFTLALLAASQIAAGLVPSPPFFPYFYAATPWMLLGVILCLAKSPDLATNVGLNAILAGCLIVSLPFAVVEYRGLPLLFWPPAWYPVHVHEIATQVARKIGTGPILTLDPIYVLDGGGSVYPALATGPFGMRVGDYLTPEQREKFKMWGTDDIQRIFAENPSAGVLISPGSDNDIEHLFEQLATQHGYKHRQINPKNPSIILWMPPRHDTE